MRKLIILLLIGWQLLLNAQSGITWGASQDIAISAYGNMLPRIALDASGKPLVIWGKMSDESVYFSRWTGAAFSLPVKLNPSWMTIATASWMGPDIASKGDTVYVVMKRTPENIDTNHIYIIRSFDGGISFSSPVQVESIADSLSRFCTVTIDDNGNPIVAFMKFNSSFLESRWVVTRSNDFGNTFITDIKASGWSGPSAEVCDCCPGTIISSGNTTAMLYRDNLSNIRDIWAGISNNNAVSFPNGFKVDNNDWMISSCPASGPDGVIIGDTLYSVFMSAASGSTLSYLSKSSISTGALASITELTASISGLNEQNYPRITKDGNAVAIVWEQTVAGNAQLPILFTNDISNSFPVNYDTIDLNDITNADVSIANGNVFVVWQDGNSRTVKFKKGTYSIAPNSIDKPQIKNINIFPNPTTDLIHLQSNEDLNDTEILITNMFGEIVLNKKISTSNDNIIDVKFLQKGLYFLSIKNDHQIITQKFVKQ